MGREIEEYSIALVLFTLPPVIYCLYDILVIILSQQWFTVCGHSHILARGIPALSISILVDLRLLICMCMSKLSLL